MQRILSVIIFAIAGMAMGSPASDSTSLPRYSFEVGRRLTYAGHSDFNYKYGSFNSVSSIQLTAVGRNADGSIRVIVRTGDRELQTSGSSHDAKPNTSPEKVSFAQLDVLPNGKVVSMIGVRFDEAPAVLSPLPADEQEMNGMWKLEPKIPGSMQIFHADGPITGNTFGFHSESEGIFKTIYGISESRKYQFDTAKGIFTSINVLTRQEYGFKGQGTGSFTLEHDETVPPEQAAALAKDCATFLAAKNVMQEKMEALSKSPDSASAVAADIRAALTRSATSVTVPEIKAQFEEITSKSLDTDIKYYQEKGQRIAKLVNRPAPELSAMDLDDKPHELSDFHGKVVVLDFWYRGCGWCMRAMPQMKQVAQDFAGKPVVVLGMNNDGKVDDAKFVVKAMDIPYMTLRSPFEAAKEFDIQLYPCVLVIDAKGIIRDLDEGYSPTLRTDLDKKIQSLLDSGAE